MAENKVELFFNQPSYLRNSSDRIAIRTKLAKDFLGNLNNVKIIDIGCGDGSLSLQFLNKTNEITFLDISKNMLKKVEEKVPEQLANNVQFINDSFSAINDKEKFDVIICVGVIAHVPAVDELFSKISSILKPNGKLIIETTPNPYPIGKLLFPYYWLRSLVSNEIYNYKKNRLKVAELMDYANNMGLECINKKRFSFPLPGMSHWSQELKLKYTLFTLNNPIASKFGSEHIFLFKRSV